MWTAEGDQNHDFGTFNMAQCLTEGKMSYNGLL